MNGYRVPLDELRFPVLRPLFEIIEDRKLSMSTVCTAAGYSDNMLSGWRCSSRNPTLRQVLDICEYLGLELIIRKKA